MTDAPLYIMDQEQIAVIEREQRDMLLERGLIYYCDTHSTPQATVYHIDPERDLVDVRVALEKQKGYEDGTLSS